MIKPPGLIQSLLYPYQNLDLIDLPGEQWKDIPGFDGNVVVSSLGRIKSLRRYVQPVTGCKGHWTRDRLLAQSCNLIKNNYTGDCTFHLTVKVGYDGKRIYLNIRRLVYELFVDNTIGKNDKNHWVVAPRDGDGRNCQAKNLELINVGERMIRSVKKQRTVLPYYKTSKKRRKEGIEKMRRKRWLKIKQYTINGQQLKIYQSIKEAAQTTGISPTGISACAKKKADHAGSFVWRYERDSYNGKYARKQKFQQIIQYSPEGKKLGKYASIREAGLKSGIHHSNIQHTLSGNTKTAGGYVWKYENLAYDGEYAATGIRGKRKIAYVGKSGRARG